MRDLPGKITAFQRVKVGDNPSLDRIQDAVATPLGELARLPLLVVRDVKTTGAAQTVDFGQRWGAFVASVGDGYVQVKQLSRTTTGVTFQASAAGVNLSLIAIF